MEHVLLVRFGELYLKGLNRPYFERKLIDHLKRVARPFGGQVERGEGRYYITGYAVDREEELAKRVCRVFGVFSISPAVAVDKDWEQVQRACVDMMRDSGVTEGTFKVQARRSDKRYPLNSPEMGRQMGGYILAQLPQMQVDVHHPQHEIGVEIRERAYLYCRSLPAARGLPAGTNGKALLLLSGGIDSPVAGYMIAHRGVEIEAVHFHSPPFTSARSLEKVVDLSARLADSCGPIRLTSVPFTEVQQTLYDKCPDSQLTILSRRFMMRIAQRVAQQNGCTALITGESIGQVASQTMEGLAASDAVVQLPVFRPCIGMDKIEIIERARAIDTLDISNRPYEDCCTVFTPKHPVIRPEIARLEQSETLVDVEGLVSRAVEGAEVRLVESAE